MARRTTEQIIADADRLADRFEQWEPDPTTMKDGAPIRAVHEAFQRAARAQHGLSEAVAAARAAEFSWAYIGGVMGTTGEAARQRYGHAPSPAKNASEKAVEPTNTKRLAG